MYLLLAAVFVIGIWVISFQWMWPLYALFAGIWAVIFIGSRLGLSTDARRARKAGIAERADQQHALIMGGKEVLGTYGQYLPPEEFRYVGPTMPDLD